MVLPIGFSAGRVVGSGEIALGTAMEGGYYAGQYTLSGTIYNLIVSPKSVETSLAWAPADSTTYTNDTDGYFNTYTRLASTAYPAANYCRNLTTGGYSDWYLPSRYELIAIYWNLKPSVAANGIDGSGANFYAVPSRNDYTSNDPTQTTATDFQVGNSQAFEVSTGYYTSTEQHAGRALRVEFQDGRIAAAYGKEEVRRVRAIRKVSAS